MAVGRRLVSLEIGLQKVEATLRTLLVWLESAPSLISANLKSDEHVNAAQSRNSDANRGVILMPFRRAIAALWQVQRQLLCSLCVVNLWLSTWDEAAVLAPFFIAGPAIFADDPAQRITLGTLMQFSNVCGHVFSALSTVANAYPELNAFAAVVVRLREFEDAHCSGGQTDASGVLLSQSASVQMPAETELSTLDHHVVSESTDDSEAASSHESRV
jgi:ABC-type uncharacterized transport system fused permease/ATPase subunit